MAKRHEPELTPTYREYRAQLSILRKMRERKDTLDSQYAAQHERVTALYRQHLEETASIPDDE